MLNKNTVPVSISIASMVVAAIALTLGGCDKSPPTKIKYPVVERVFMHETSKYSILVRNNDNKELDSVEWDWTYKIHIVDDVLSTQKIWAEVDDKQVYIHIHSAQEINGAGWNHGKGGQGETIGVE